MTRSIRLRISLNLSTDLLFIQTGFPHQPMRPGIAGINRQKRMVQIKTASFITSSMTCTEERSRRFTLLRNAFILSHTGRTGSFPDHLQRHLALCMQCNLIGNIHYPGE